MQQGRPLARPQPVEDPQVLRVARVPGGNHQRPQAALPTLRWREEGITRRISMVAFAAHIVGGHHYQSAQSGNVAVFNVAVVVLLQQRIRERFLRHEPGIADAAVVVYLVAIVLARKNPLCHGFGGGEFPDAVALAHIVVARGQIHGYVTGVVLTNMAGGIGLLPQVE